MPRSRSPARRRPRGHVVRFAVSLEPELLDRLDHWVRARNSGSRSEAIRALIRKELTEEVLGDSEAPAVGAVLVLYRHDSPLVQKRLTVVEHRWGGRIRFSGHVHLKGEACMELIAVSGSRSEVLRIAEDLRGVKGVAFGDFSIGTPSILKES
jgi:CopG family nickel-responsive transcriptional regulator